MSAVEGAPRPDPAVYMSEVARSAPGRAYKDHVLASLRLQPGLTALDVGCGPGTDLLDLADGVGPTGLVVGVDHDETMLAAAARCTSGSGRVELRHGDAHALPVESGSVDRVRVDRVLQHVEDPAAVVAELARVVRPGGLVALAEPDWETLVVDSTDPATSRAFTRYTCEHVVCNPGVGRSLARLAAAAGLVVRDVALHPVLFDDLGTADQVLGLARNSTRAADEGRLDRAAATAWFAGLADGPFVAATVLFTVLAEAPAG